jgi:hypothetical protein
MGADWRAGHLLYQRWNQIVVWAHDYSGGDFSRAQQGQAILNLQILGAGRIFVMIAAPAHSADFHSQ